MEGLPSEPRVTSRTYRSWPLVVDRQTREESFWAVTERRGSSNPSRSILMGLISLGFLSFPFFLSSAGLLVAGFVDRFVGLRIIFLVFGFLFVILFLVAGLVLAPSSLHFFSFSSFSSFSAFPGLAPQFLASLFGASGDFTSFRSGTANN